MRKKLIKYAPFVIVLVVCYLYQISLITKQQFQPFPDPFGRETQVTQTTVKSAVQTIRSNQFAYLSGDSLTYVTLDEQGKSSVSKRSLPDSDWKEVYKFNLTEDQAFWIGNDDKLYLSRWKDNSWGKKQELTHGQTNAFHIVQNGTQQFVLWSDDRTVHVGLLTGDAFSDWQTLQIQDVSDIKAILDKQGRLSIASQAEQSNDNVELWFTQLDPVTHTLLKQSKVKHLSLHSSNHVEDLQLGLDTTNAYLFYIISSTKSSNSEFYNITFPIDQLHKVSESKVEVLSENGQSSRQVYQPHVLPEQDDHVTLVVSSLFQKDDRFAHQEPYLLEFKNGQKVSETRVSGGRGETFEPALLKNQNGSRQVVWLDPFNDGMFNVYYTTDIVQYRERMNVITSDDRLWALKMMPLFTGFGVLLLLYTFKWFPLPYIYLFIVRLKNENQYFDRARLHFWIASGIYLIMKLIFIGDFYRPAAIPFMPSYMLLTYSPYLIVVAILLFSYLGTRLWRPSLPERNPLLEVSYLFLIDIFASTLWFSYFLSPASF